MQQQEQIFGDHSGHSFLYPHASGDRLSLQSVIQSSDADHPRELQHQQVVSNLHLHLPADQVWGSQSTQSTHPSLAHHHQLQGTPANNRSSVSLPQHTISGNFMNEGASYAQLHGGSTLQPAFSPPLQQHQQQEPQQQFSAYAQLEMHQGRLSSSQGGLQSDGQSNMSGSWQHQQQENLSSFDLAPLMRSHPEGHWHSSQQSIAQPSNQNHGPHIIRMAAPTGPRVPTGRHIDFRNTAGALGVLHLPNAYGMRPAAGSDVYAAVAPAPVLGGSQYGRPQGHRPPKLGTVATYNPATGIRSSEPIGSQVTMISSGVLGAGRVGSNVSSPATSSCQVASPFGALSQAQVQLQLQQQQQQHLQVQQRQQTVSSIGLQQLQAGQLRQQQVTTQAGIQLQQQHAQQQRQHQLQHLQQQQQLHQQQLYQQGSFTPQQSTAHSADGQPDSRFAVGSVGSSSSASVDGHQASFLGPNSAGQQHVHNASWSDYQNAHSMARVLVQNAQQQRSVTASKNPATPPHNMLVGDCDNSSSGSSPQQQRLWQKQSSIPGSMKPNHLNVPNSMLLHGLRGPAGAANLGSYVAEQESRTSHHSAPQLQLPPGTARLIAQSNMRGNGSALLSQDGVRRESLLSLGMCSSNGWSLNNDSSESAESSASQASEVQQLLQRMYPTANHQQLLAILSQQGLGASLASDSRSTSQVNSMSQQEIGASHTNSRSQHDFGFTHEASMMQPGSSHSGYAKDAGFCNNGSREDNSPQGPPPDTRLEPSGSLTPQAGPTDDAERNQPLSSVGTQSSLNSSVSGCTVSGTAWLAQQSSAPYATAAAAAAAAATAMGGLNGAGSRFGEGNCPASKDADVELDVLLSCIGSELARNGITVQEAAAAGWLGDLTTDSTSTLLASFQCELQRLNGSSSSNGQGSSAAAPPPSGFSGAVGVGATAIAIPQRADVNVPQADSGSSREHMIGGTGGAASAASSNPTREFNIGSLPTQTGGATSSAPLSSRFGFAAPSASHTTDSIVPRHQSGEGQVLDLPVTSFENLFLGSGFR